MIAAMGWMGSSGASAQPPAGAAAVENPNVAVGPGGAGPRDPSTQQITQFAPGVVQVIPPNAEPEETFTGPLALETFLKSNPQIVFGGDTHPDGKPHFGPKSGTLAEMAKQVVLRREIYCFEFAFKPLRQIYVDVPQPNGKLKRKLIWYMVYRVDYVGGDLRPKSTMINDRPVFQRLEAVHYDSRRFVPVMKLRNEVTDKTYVDSILPTATATIKRREQITAPLYNNVEITRIPVPYNGGGSDGGVWGVVTWEDVDPNLDFVSIEVYGLTNAFERDGLATDAPYRRKALQLNFFRPGDVTNPTADRIRFGVPAFRDPNQQQYVLDQYGLDERLDYRWIFR